MIAPPPKHRSHSMNDRTAAKRTAAPRHRKHYLRGVAANLIVLSHSAPAWSGSSLPVGETYLHDLHLRLARIETLLENTSFPLRTEPTPTTLPSASC